MEEQGGEEVNEAFESGWALIKAMRGTSAEWFDEAKRQGAFPSRHGTTSFDQDGQPQRISGVWATGADDPHTAFNYAASKNMKPDVEPVVHTLEEPGARPQNADTDQMAVRAMRYDESDFPEGVPSQNAEKVWHGPSFETYMANPSIRPEHRNMSEYLNRMRRDYRRSAARYYRNKGSMPLDSIPEHNTLTERLKNDPYFEANRGLEWAKTMSETPGEDAEWAFQQSLRHVAEPERRMNDWKDRGGRMGTNREAILPPTLTGKEKPWYKRERSTIASWDEVNPRGWIGRDKGWDWNTGENRGKWADILMTDEEKQERARKKREEDDPWGGLWADVM